MQQFKITFKNEKQRSYRLIILLLVVLHVLFFIYLLFDETYWKKAAIGLIVVALYSAYRILKCKSDGRKFSYGSGFFFPFAFFFTVPWLWVADAVLFVLSTLALQKTSLYFTSENIAKNNFPSRKFEWSQFTNVVLKDNILTLDFTNNKLLQAEIEPTDISEDAFNTFAKEQLVNT